MSQYHDLHVHKWIVLGLHRLDDAEWMREIACSRCGAVTVDQVHSENPIVDLGVWIADKAA